MDKVYCLFGVDGDSFELLTLHRNESDAIQCFNELWSKSYSSYKIITKKDFLIMENFGEGYLLGNYHLNFGGS